MDMTMAYIWGSATNVRENPKFYMKVYRDRGDGISTETALCLGYVRNAGPF